MAERLIQIVVPGDRAESLRELVSSVEGVESWHDASDDVRMITVQVPADRVEAVLDPVQSALGHVEGFHAFVFSLEAALPTRKEEEKEAGAPAWMVTYGDMMTLLLTFFVLLLSFSSIQESKFERAMGSLKRALGVMKYSSGLQQKMHFFRNTVSSNTDDVFLDQVMGMKETLEKSGLQQEVKVTMTERGVHIIIADQILFDLGKDRLKTDIIPVLDIVTDLMKEAPESEIVIEGHTDNWPINSARFPTNWELSAARALAVVKYFAFRKGIEPARFAATGYGEYRPLKPNDTAEHRAMNRRVEIFINTRDKLKSRISQTVDEP